MSTRRHHPLDGLFESGRPNRTVGITLTRIGTSVAIAAGVGWVVAPLPVVILGLPAVAWAVPLTLVSSFIVLRSDSQRPQVLQTGLHALAGCAVVHPLVVGLPAAKSATTHAALTGAFESLIVGEAIALVAALLLVALGRLLTRRAGARRGSPSVHRPDPLDRGYGTHTGGPAPADDRTRYPITAESNDQSRPRTVQPP